MSNQVNQMPGHFEDIVKNINRTSRNNLAWEFEFPAEMDANVGTDVGTKLFNMSHCISRCLHLSLRYFHIFSTTWTCQRNSSCNSSGAVGEVILNCDIWRDGRERSKVHTKTLGCSCQTGDLTWCGGELEGCPSRGMARGVIWTAERPAQTWYP